MTNQKIVDNLREISNVVKNFKNDIYFPKIAGVVDVDSACQSIINGEPVCSAELSALLHYIADIMEE